MRNGGVGLGEGEGDAPGVGEGVCAGEPSDNFETTSPVTPSAGRDLTNVRLSTFFLVLLFFIVL